jgi:hypothetical protein
VETITDVVVRFISGGPTNATLHGINALTGQQLDVPVASTTSGAKQVPLAAVASVLKATKKDDYLVVTLSTLSGSASGTTVKSAQAYTLVPPEDEADCYIYQSTGKQRVGPKDAKEVPVVKATKFRKEFVFLVPQAKDANGALAPDGNLWNAAAAFKSGDGVEIAATKGGSPDTLKDGTFGKLDKQNVGQVAYSALFIKDANGAAQTLLVPMGQPGAPFLAKVAGMKEGDSIQYKSSTDDKGNVWVVLLKAGNKATAAKN